ncbi:hypothetical protein GCM10027514_33000 [Azotobacter armeniacus]
MVRESQEPGQSISVVARRNEINPNQLFHCGELRENDEARLHRPHAHDRATALRNLTIAFEHCNEQHPHSALK